MTKAVNWRTLAICTAGGFCATSLFMVFLMTTRDVTTVEALAYFFMSWVSLSGVCWMGWRTG